jgi:ubiquinone/menaquinone biosynthesis C-methylase UbiE
MLDARGSRGAIARAYGLAAPLYGLWSTLFEERAIQRGLALASVRKGERILEVAVGPGAALAKLHREAGPAGLVVGIDIAPGMLRAARRRVPDAALALADARALPFRGGAFDMVWSSYFLDLIPTCELTPLLKEFCRVLRPDGRLLLVDLSKKGKGKIWWERFYSISPGFLIPYVFGGCRPIHAAQFVRDAGFVLIQQEIVSQGMVSEILLVRKAA